ncbi:MAG: InlB B-repeat-containing protein, partial [Lachnospiraceae bacterium]|nr:InlB B-repeat-containing protein [Lachnospiraceae bacterium]
MKRISIRQIGRSALAALLALSITVTGLPLSVFAEAEAGLVHMIDAEAGQIAGSGSGHAHVDGDGHVHASAGIVSGLKASAAVKNEAEELANPEGESAVADDAAKNEAEPAVPLEGEPATAVDSGKGADTQLEETVTTTYYEVKFALLPDQQEEDISLPETLMVPEGTLISSLPTASRANSVFTGWGYDEEGRTLAAADAIVDRNMTLYPHLAARQDLMATPVDYVSALDVDPTYPIVVVSYGLSQKEVEEKVSVSNLSEGRADVPVHLIRVPDPEMQELFNTLGTDVETDRKMAAAIWRLLEGPVEEENELTQGEAGEEEPLQEEASEEEPLQGEASEEEPEQGEAGEGEPEQGEAGEEEPEQGEAGEAEPEQGEAGEAEPGDEESNQEVLAEEEYTLRAGLEAIEPALTEEQIARVLYAYTPDEVTTEELLLIADLDEETLQAVKEAIDKKKESLEKRSEETPAVAQEESPEEILDESEAGKESSAFSFTSALAELGLDEELAGQLIARVAPDETDAPKEVETEGEATQYQVVFEDETQETLTLVPLETEVEVPEFVEIEETKPAPGTEKLTAAMRAFLKEQGINPARATRQEIKEFYGLSEEDSLQLYLREEKDFSPEQILLLEEICSLVELVPTAYYLIESDRGAWEGAELYQAAISDTYRLRYLYGGEATEEEVTYYNITVYMEEVNNLRLNASVGFIPLADVQGVELGSLIRVDTREGENQVAFANDMVGVLTYTGNRTLFVGERIAVYDGILNEDASVDGNVGYFTITEDLGDGQFAYEGADVVDVLFHPDNIPVLDDGTFEDGEVLLAPDQMDFSDPFYEQLHLNSSTVIEAGDFLTFYSGSLMDPSLVGYGAITEVTGEGENLLIHYTVATLEEITAHQEMFLDMGDVVVTPTPEEQEVLSASMVQQLSDSGIAEEMALYLQGILTAKEVDIDQFDHAEELKKMTFLTDDGSEMTVEKLRTLAGGASGIEVGEPQFALAFDYGDLVHFTGRKGVRGQVSLSIKITLSLGEAMGTKQQLVITPTVALEQELTLKPSVKVKMHWDWYGIFYLWDGLSFIVGFEAGTYTGFGAQVQVVTSKEDIGNDSEWEDLINENNASFQGSSNMDSTLVDLMVMGGKKLEERAKKQEEKEKEKAPKGITMGMNDIEKSGTFVDMVSGDLPQKYAQFIANDPPYVPVFTQEIFTFAAPVDPWHLVEVSVGAYLVVSIKVNALMGVSLSYEHLKKFTYHIDVTWRGKTCKEEETELVRPTFRADFYSFGMIGVRAGVSLDLRVGILSTKFDSVGVVAEVGAYAELYGFLYVSYLYQGAVGEEEEVSEFKIQGALLLEIGIYLEIRFKAQLGDDKLKFEKNIYSNTWPILQLGALDIPIDFEIAANDKKLNVEIPEGKSLAKVPDELFQVKIMGIKDGVTAAVDKDSSKVPDEGTLYEGKDGQLYTQYNEINFNVQCYDLTGEGGERIEGASSFRYLPATNEIVVKPQAGVTELWGEIDFFYSHNTFCLSSAQIGRTVKVHWKGTGTAAEIRFYVQDEKNPEKYARQGGEDLFVTPGVQSSIQVEDYYFYFPGYKLETLSLQNDLLTSDLVTLPESYMNAIVAKKGEIPFKPAEEGKTVLMLYYSLSDAYKASWYVDGSADGTAVPDIDDIVEEEMREGVPFLENLPEEVTKYAEDGKGTIQWYLYTPALPTDKPVSLEEAKQHQSEWVEVTEKTRMPGNCATLVGYAQAASYKVTWVFDGETVRTDTDVHFGDKLVAPEVTAERGYYVEDWTIGGQKGNDALLSKNSSFKYPNNLVITADVEPVDYKVIVYIPTKKASLGDCLKNLTKLVHLSNGLWYLETPMKVPYDSLVYTTVGKNEVVQNLEEEGTKKDEQGVPLIQTYFMLSPELGNTQAELPLDYRMPVPHSNNLDPDAEPEALKLYGRLAKYRRIEWVNTDIEAPSAEEGGSGMADYVEIGSEIPLRDLEEKSGKEAAWVITDKNGVTTRLTAGAVMPDEEEYPGALEAKSFWFDKNHEHVWEEVELIKEESCVSEGSHICVCAVCKLKQEMVIPKSQAKHTGGTERVKKADATCKKAGYTGDKVCIGCGAVLERGSAIPATGKHTWDEGKVTKEATCSQTGVMLYTCSTCQDTYTEVIPLAADHHSGTLMTRTTRTATCVQEGQKVTICSACGQIAGTETIPKNPNNHTGEMVVSGFVAAACGTDGYTGDLVCADCKAVLEAGVAVKATGSHLYGNPVIDKAATCAAEGQQTLTCSVCGDKKTEVIPKNAAAHTGKTKLVDAKEPTCKEPGYSGDLICEDCGAVLEGGKELPVTDDKHIWDDGTLKTVATCVAEGEMLYTCTVCGATKSETIPIDKKTHNGKTELKNAKDATCSEKGYTGDLYCADCGELVKKGEDIAATGQHIFTKATITKKATCVSEGTRKLTCLTCDETKEETIPKNPKEHEGEQVVRNAKAATCGEDGYTGDTYCESCGQPIKAGEVIDATGEHSWNEGEFIVVPTCVDEGVYQYTCTVCGLKKNERTGVMKDNHTGNYEIIGAKEPTCSEEGFSGDKYCTDCGEIVVNGVILPATGEHVYDDGVITTPATCVSEGVKTFTCTICQEATYTEAVPKDPNNHAQALVEVPGKAATCTEPGNTGSFKCEACGFVQENEEIPALGHAWGRITYRWSGDMTSVTASRTCSRCSLHETEVAAIENGKLTSNVITAPTCQSEGESVYLATFENAEFGQHEMGYATPKAGHTLSEAVRETVAAATCTEPGSYDLVVYCDVCGTEISRETFEEPALGHTPKEAVKEKEVAATCTEAGSYDMVVYCDVCGTEISRETFEEPALGHTPKEAVKEKEVAATCTEPD